MPASVFFNALSDWQALHKGEAFTMPWDGTPWRCGAACRALETAALSPSKRAYACSTVVLQVWRPSVLGPCVLSLRVDTLLLRACRGFVLGYRQRRPGDPFWGSPWLSIAVEWEGHSTDRK